MSEIICLTPHLPESIYAEIGNKNKKITAKQNYDFLLRAAVKYPVKLLGSSKPFTIDSYNPWDAFQTDCNIAGKYQQELLDTSYFDPVIETLITSAATFPNSKKAINWLKKMISHAPEYYEIDDNTRPIFRSAF